ncbi:tRNA threonylcarbamoyladenosine biosynthesis protein TsaE [Krasilnikovia cinnamomea]|uniref:tRNA threonylcarbamoyladenosine biosynthesis protein TsaE n=1 Tax=Krasilnikovia cinnamomea TaxID=349313 RepID=A0A4Q7ZM15_9ACTN|nr:tRNA threonylcarbamoyladenosine biosynthesis protein TsaE [Krasilnikovia cinnamomea]
MITTGIRLATVDDTRQFGRWLATLLRRGDLVLLTGPLGAGKTALTQGIGAGLGVRGDITSPTFVIARVHRPDPARGGRVALVHADAYRLGDAADPRGEIDDLDLDASAGDSVTVVEWGEGLAEQLNDEYLQVRIARLDDDTRVLDLVAHGAAWAQRLAVADPTAASAAAREETAASAAAGEESAAGDRAATTGEPAVADRAAATERLDS